MSITQTSDARATAVPTPGTTDLKLEVVTIPVSDIDRAKSFYERLGWRLDADFKGDGWRAVQLTPPGSPCSIHLGDPGSGPVQGLFLVVDDIEAARADLLGRGVDVSEPFHFAGIRGPKLPGPDPGRGTYRSYASFNDPDGNGWLLQEITTRLPGRGLSHDVATLTSLLREAEEHHGAYEATAPKHHWSDWYAAYIVARQQGKTPEEAAADAPRHIR
jgi:catechol 2,3-dioxygenase-like lactoylglutathione lyase family enzyme